MTPVAFAIAVLFSTAAATTSGDSGNRLAPPDSPGAAHGLEAHGPHGHGGHGPGDRDVPHLRRGPRDRPGPRDPRAPRDDLVLLLRRIDRYFQQHEVDGVVIDSRYVLNYTEAARLSVVSQLLAYEELYKVFPTPRLRQDIADRADFLIGIFDQVRSGGVFDGMLGYSFLDAFAATRDPRYLEKGTAIVQELEGLESQYILNGGLMAAMAFAKYHQLTGDAEAERLTHEIIATLPPYQHPDGSFPHWCACSRDVHYTDWMATELILIQRMLDDPLIDPMLEKMRAFMEARVYEDGVTRYQESCNDFPGCVVYYYSIATGCTIDYDTRAFTNELGYSALLFDHFHSPRYVPVMRFLHGLESGGTWADKWDFWPTPDDPYYPWTAADTSVVNTSLIFWSLGSVLSGRRERPSPAAWEDEAVPAAGAPVAGALGPLPDGRRLGSLRWSTVDRLLLSGADPERFCDGVTESGIVDDLRRGEAQPEGATGSGDGGVTSRGAESNTVAVAGGARGAAPLTPRLESVTPNPSGGTCTLRFTLPAPASVTLAIYDAAGRRIRALVSGPISPGEHEVRWDRRDGDGAVCGSGIYFVVLRAGEGTRSARLLVIR